jgi:hypothetical protein
MLLAVAVLMLTAAADTPPAETITYATQPAGPMCGECRTTKLVVTSDGDVRQETGWWARNRRNWKTAIRTWKVTPEQYAKFRERLALYRPQGKLSLTRQPECDDYMPDSGAIVINWHGGGPDSELYYDLGCDPLTRREMRKDIETALMLLA